MKISPLGLIRVGWLKLNAFNTRMEFLQIIFGQSLQPSGQLDSHGQSKFFNHALKSPIGHQTIGARHHCSVTLLQTFSLGRSFITIFCTINEICITLK